MVAAFVALLVAAAKYEPQAAELLAFLVSLVGTGKLPASVEMHVKAIIPSPSLTDIAEAKLAAQVVKDGD